MKLYIVAPSYQAFKNYCWRHNVPLDGSAKYVSTPHALQGLSLQQNQLRFVAGWQTLPGHREIERAAHAAVSKMIRK